MRVPNASFESKYLAQIVSKSFAGFVNCIKLYYCKGPLKHCRFACVCVHTLGFLQYYIKSQHQCDPGFVEGLGEHI